MRNCPEKNWIISILKPSPAFFTWHPCSCFIQWETEGSFKHLASSSETMAKRKTPTALPGSWILLRVMVCFDGSGEVWRGQHREPSLLQQTCPLSRFRDFTIHEWHLLLRFAQRYPYLALIAGLQFSLLTSTRESLQIPSKKKTVVPALILLTIFFSVKINFISYFQSTFLMHLIWATFPSSRPAPRTYWTLHQHLLLPFLFHQGNILVLARCSHFH